MKKYKTFAVYQIRKNAPARESKIFKPYAWVKEKFGKVNMSDYWSVYFGRQKVETLDDVFTMCNLNHPSGYLGHSLSVSDVVELDGELWYCDVIGWVKLREATK